MGVCRLQRLRILQASRDARKIQAGSLCYIVALQRGVGVVRGRTGKLDYVILAVDHPLNAGVWDEQGMVAASATCIAQSMFAYQHEVTKACTPDSPLSPGAPRIAGYDRGDHGVVGVGAGDQTMATRSSKLAGGLGCAGICNEAYRGRRANLLPLESAGRTRKRFLVSYYGLSATNSKCRDENSRITHVHVSGR
jgi:hypothetical protein